MSPIWFRVVAARTSSGSRHGLSPVWMPFAEAVKRAGSFEALRPHLREGRILAHHNGLYSWPGGEAMSGPGDIPPELVG